MTNLIRKINLWAEKSKRYRKTVRELSSLSDRDLGDIGISRCDIPAIARKNGRI